jgi:hypothetical protein
MTFVLTGFVVPFLSAVPFSYSITAVPVAVCGPFSCTSIVALNYLWGPFSCTAIVVPVCLCGPFSCSIVAALLRLCSPFSCKSIVQILYAVHFHFRVLFLILYAVRSHVRVLLSKFSTRTIFIFEYVLDSLCGPFSCKSIVVQVLCAVLSHFRVLTMITLAVLSHVWVLWSPFLYAVRFQLWALLYHFCMRSLLMWDYYCLGSSMRSVTIYECCLRFSMRSVLTYKHAILVFCCSRVLLRSQFRRTNIDSGHSCHHRPQFARGYSLCTPFRSTLLGLERPR